MDWSRMGKEGGSGREKALPGCRIRAADPGLSPGIDSPIGRPSERPPPMHAKRRPRAPKFGFRNSGRAGRAGGGRQRVPQTLPYSARSCQCGPAPTWGAAAPDFSERSPERGGDPLSPGRETASQGRTPRSGAAPTGRRRPDGPREGAVGERGRGGEPGVAPRPRDWSASPQISTALSPCPIPSPSYRSSSLVAREQRSFK